MALWTAGLLLLLGLIWFVAAVVVPVWQVRSTVKKYSQGWSERNPGGRENVYDLIDPMIPKLGGSKRAARRLGLYLRLPEVIAPRKKDAFSLLGKCEHEDAIPEARPLLTSKSPKLRAGAVYYLGHQDPDLVRIMPALVVALQDTEPDVRTYAAIALASRGKDALQAVPALERALKDNDDGVRYYAAIALKAIRGEEAGK